jgi:hypothetical protein
VDLLSRRYQDFRDSLGVRPSAAEMFREGYNPRTMRAPFGSWLGFVKSQAGLTEEDGSAFVAIQSFLEALETTEMSRSYKMLALLALINRNPFPGSMSLAELAEEIRTMGRRDPRVARDVGSSIDLASRIEVYLLVG